MGLPPGNLGRLWHLGCLLNLGLPFSHAPGTSHAERIQGTQGTNKGAYMQLK